MAIKAFIWGVLKVVFSLRANQSESLHPKKKNIELLGFTHN
jgi:hypothetical protein